MVLQQRPQVAGVVLSMPARIQIDVSLQLHSQLFFK
jgi:hypothetical protein